MSDYEKLKRLINSSNSLNDKEKKLLIDKIPELNESEVQQAIVALEIEQEKWEELRKNDEAALKIFDDYVDVSNEEIDKEYKKIIDKVEKRKADEESAKADNLLKKL